MKLVTHQIKNNHLNIKEKTFKKKKKKKLIGKKKVYSEREKE